MGTHHFDKETESSSPRISRTQYEALHLLYNSTAGEQWIYPFQVVPWNFSNVSSDPCMDEWGGVTCDNITNATAVVTKLSLASYNLVGYIPVGFARSMDSLDTLELSKNSISGKIPSSIGSLGNLTRLDLESNLITGSIPSDIGNLTNLTYLNLSRNQLTGPIKQKLSNLKVLGIMKLNDNKINGSIPAWLENLECLTVLYLHRNRLTGVIPSQLFRMTGLKELLIGQNPYDAGSIPTFIGNMQSLQTLFLGRSNLIGKIPSELSALKEMSVLLLWENSLTGSIPDLSNMKNLTVLDINDNALTGPFPDIHNSKSIFYFSISGNRLTGSIPNYMSEFVQLTFFLVFENFFTGQLPNFSKMELQYLDVGRNFFSGHIPDVGSVTSLKHLNMSKNQLTGPLPANFCNLSNVQDFSLASNQLTGNLIVPASSVLVVLDLSNNKLEGSVPHSLHLEVPALMTLSLSLNCLSTSLPNDLCDHSSLQTLLLDDLHDWEKCGGELFDPVNELPSCLFQMNSLRSLHIAGNKMKADISSLNISSLHTLVASYNLLYGTLPSSLNGQSFQQFDVSHNRIKGNLYRDIVAVSDNSHLSSSINAEVNRMSGGLYLYSIESFESVEVLQGNIFSCEYDLVDDEYYDRYKCGSSEFEIALYVWISIVGFVCICMIFIWKLKWAFPVKTSMLKFGQYDEIKSISTNDYGFLLRMNRALDQWKWKMIVVTTWLLIMTVILFVGFKYNGKETYRVFDTQYLYSISGYFLKGIYPAVALAIVYLLCFILVVYFYYDLFAAHLSSYKNDAGANEKSFTGESQSYKKIKAVVVVLVFMAFVFSIYYGFVKLSPMTSPGMQFLLELAVASIKTLNVEYGVSFLIYLMYDDTMTPSWSACAISVALIFYIDILMPLVALILVDDTCLGHYEDFSRDEISTVYDHDVCTDFNSELSCINYVRWTSKAWWKPPFIYSGHCRDALTLYVPIVLLSCVWKTVLQPIYYFVSTSKVRSLDEVYRVLGVDIPIGIEVFRDSVYGFSKICHEISLLMLFGLLDPLCAFAVGLSILASIEVLKVSILRAYQLTKDANVGGSKGKSALNMDVVCENMLHSAPYAVWPGLLLSSLVVALFIADMAQDTEDTELSASISLFTIVIVVVYGVFGLFAWKLMLKNNACVEKDAGVELNEYPLSEPDSTGSLEVEDSGSEVENPVHAAIKS